MLIDSHCHLDHWEEGEREGLVRRAGEAGVGTLITIGVRLRQAAVVKAIAEAFPPVWCTVGVHPHNAAEEPMPEVSDLVTLAEHPRVVGIGESGLDYHYNKAPRDIAAESFRRHIRAARETGLPLVVHARDADSDISLILKDERERGGAFPFVLHCFSSGRQLAEDAVAIGGYVSFSGIITFRLSDELRAIARDLPPERLLVETDAPYLAPEPFRGKRCEPALVTYTAKALASLRGLPIPALAELTTANTLRLFSRLRAAAAS